MYRGLPEYSGDYKVLSFVPVAVGDYRDFPVTAGTYRKLLAFAEVKYAGVCWITVELNRSNLLCL